MHATTGQHALHSMRRMRSLWVGARTLRINALRGFCEGFGLAIPVGAHRFCSVPGCRQTRHVRLWRSGARWHGAVATFNGNN